VEEEVEEDVTDDEDGDHKDDDDQNQKAAEHLFDKLDESMTELMAHLVNDSDMLPESHVRKMTLEENDDAMKKALQAEVHWKDQLKVKPLKKAPPKVKSQKTKIDVIEEKVERQEQDYARLKEVDWVALDNKEELAGHALELHVLFQEQKALVEGLQQSKEIILDYLKGDNREALIKWFKIRGII